ncbi:RimK/LysX family protein [Kangiella sp. HZ709]|uniref:ATP-dependent zinc protease family protein n=1 Tax=Kangiella sp. HZ709 TaxID=2666328 RepID=UPI0012B00CAB|nr:RimK/LysX family protein [Kangiella sp. HZ709]MRX26916.1 hypothetical protein [Kangiella sp. HZ709]
MLTVGWCELATLSELGIFNLPVKIDTGAKTSSIHAVNIETFQKEEELWVRFNTTDTSEAIKVIEAPVFDQRDITSSNGITETRFVIKTSLQMANQSWSIELTLADRSKMRFKMLLGRKAMDNIQVIPSKKCLLKNVNINR